MIGSLVAVVSLTVVFIGCSTEIEAEADDPRPVTSLAELSEGDPALQAAILAAVAEIQPRISDCVDPYRSMGLPKLEVRLRIGNKGRRVTVDGAALENERALPGDLAPCLRAVFATDQWGTLPGVPPFSGDVLVNLCPAPRRPRSPDR